MFSPATRPPLAANLPRLLLAEKQMLEQHYPALILAHGTQRLPLSIFGETEAGASAVRFPLQLSNTPRRCSDELGL